MQCQCANHPTHTKKARRVRATIPCAQVVQSHNPIHIPNYHSIPLVQAYKVEDTTPPGGQPGGQPDGQMNWGDGRSNGPSIDDIDPKMFMGGVIALIFTMTNNNGGGGCNGSNDGTLAILFLCVLAICFMNRSKDTKMSITIG